jgi:hypothetical protein
VTQEKSNMRRLPQPKGNWISFKIVKGGDLGTMSVTPNIARSGGIAGDGQVSLSEKPTPPHPTSLSYGNGWLADFGPTWNWGQTDPDVIIHFPPGAYLEGDLYTFSPSGELTCSREGAPMPSVSCPGRGDHHSNWHRTTP